VYWLLEIVKVTVLARKKMGEDGVSTPLAEMIYLRLDETPIDVEIKATSII
jgi:hypothetical protein